MNPETEDPPTLSETESSTLDQSDSTSSSTSSNSTIIRNLYATANSSQYDSTFAQSLLPAMSTTSISYKPPTNASTPSASVLKHLVKLSTGNYVAWRRDLEILLDSCGLGEFVHSLVPEPNVAADIPLWRMHRAQVLLSIRTTIDAHNLNAISGAQHPFDAISILARRHGHGENVGLAVANAISAIVFQRFDNSISIEEFVSNTQVLHNELSELTTTHPGFKLNDEILALLLLIKLPREQFNSLIQNLLGDLKNFTTDLVFNRLLTESQSMKPVVDDTATAMTAQSRRKLPKGDRSSKEPSALCHLPSHSLSMHSNAECRTQNPSLPPVRQNNGPRPMGRPGTSSTAAPSRGLSAISSLTDAEKIRLFDQLQTAQANAVTQSQPTPEEPDERVVYLANAYSAVAQSPVKSQDMVSDTGADRFIFHSIEWFSNL